MYASFASNSLLRRFLGWDMLLGAEKYRGMLRGPRLLGNGMKASQVARRMAETTSVGGQTFRSTTAVGGLGVTTATRRERAKSRRRVLQEAGAKAECWSRCKASKAIRRLNATSFGILCTVCGLQKCLQNSQQGVERRQPRASKLGRIS